MNSSITINHFGCIINKKDIEQDELLKLKKYAILSPQSFFGNFQKKDVKAFLELEKYLIIPIYLFFEFYKESPPLYNVKFNFGQEIPYLKNTIILREEQQKVFDKIILERLKPFGGGILSLRTAFGKTLISLKLICEFKSKCIIVVNKVELMNQWEEQIKKWIPDIQIGKIQGNIFNINAPISIAMLQSVSIKKKLTANDFKEFKLCIIDEVHNIPSDIFSRIIFKIRPRFLFGLTATLKRKDGCEKLINWYMGETLYDNTEENKGLKQTSEIHQYVFSSIDLKEVTLKDGTPSVSTMLTNLANNKERNNLLYKIILDLNKEPLRNILVISDRVSQLKHLYNNLQKNKEVSVGLFIGSLKKQELEESKTKKIILATYGLISEGVNIPKLNTLVFGTPRSSIIQAIGRIYRQEHAVMPIIVDIKDLFSLFPGQFYRRNLIYKKSIENPIILSKKN